MEETYITVNKNIPFTLGSNSKTILNFFGTRCNRGFHGRVSFSAKLFQVALSGRDAENYLKLFL